MKKMLLLLAGSLIFVSANGQRRSSFLNDPIYIDQTRSDDHRAVEQAPKQTEAPKTGTMGATTQDTYRPSHYDYNSNSTFLPDYASRTDYTEERSSRTGQRLDLSLALGAGSQKIKPTDKNESYLKAGVSATGYLVMANKKDAMGLTLDFSGENLFNIRAFSYNLLAGPAYSHNFTPFGKTHVCLDLAAGYMLKVNRVSTSVRIPEYRQANHLLNQHTIGFKAGVSAFKWVGDIPMEYRLNVYMQFGPSILMSGDDK